MVKKLSLIAALCLAVLGCEEAHDETHPVPIDQVPPKLMEVAHKQLPGLKFDRAFQIEVNGKTAYEIRGKDKQGKIREVEVSQDGELIEVE